MLINLKRVGILLKGPSRVSLRSIKTRTYCHNPKANTFARDKKSKLSLFYQFPFSAEPKGSGSSLHPPSCFIFWSLLPLSLVDIAFWRGESGLGRYFTARSCGYPALRPAECTKFCCARTHKGNVPAQTSLCIHAPKTIYLALVRHRHHPISTVLFSSRFPTPLLWILPTFRSFQTFYATARRIISFLKLGLNFWSPYWDISMLFTHSPIHLTVRGCKYIQSCR